MGMQIFFFLLVHCQLCTFDLLSIHEEQFGSFYMYVSARIDWLIHQFKELSLQSTFVFSLFKNNLSLQHFIILEFWALFGIVLGMFHFENEWRRTCLAGTFSLSFCALIESLSLSSSSL